MAMKIDSNTSGSIKPNSLVLISCVSTSKSEPIAISRKRLNSTSLFLVHPLAILEGTETAALVIWLLKPNFSAEGDFLIINILDSQVQYRSSKYQVF